MFVELLTLFWMFFKIGLFTFGGGYAMIPLIQQELVGGGYIEASLLYDFIGISESAPGPVAINMATFIGMNQYGILGAVATTLGVALPSFIIILLIATLGSKLIESKGVGMAFKGLKPAVIGLIFSVSVVLISHAIFPMIHFDQLHFDFSIFNWRTLIIMGFVLLAAFFYKKISPIQVIMISALLGIIMYSFF